ncbi:hypothetical protein ACFW35_18310 [Fictibacillus sp. NPDC058756]|uniref:hypothetical protein n=1 Tax=Fictibacillus sp. NPDC058756 TaxID=3346625 RepID=UPI00369F89AA
MAKIKRFTIRTISGYEIDKTFNFNGETLEDVLSEFKEDVLSKDELIIRNNNNETIVLKTSSIESYRIENF